MHTRAFMNASRGHVHILMRDYYMQANGCWKSWIYHILSLRAVLNHDLPQTMWSNAYFDVEELRHIPTLLLNAAMRNYSRYKYAALQCFHNTIIVKSIKSLKSTKMQKNILYDKNQ